MAEAHTPEIDLMAPLRLALKRWRLILAFTLLGGLFGGLYLSFQVPQYSATALLQLNVQDQIVMDAQGVATNQVDAAAIQSELDILASYALMRRVVQKLQLHERAEFNPDLEAKTLLWQLRHAPGALFGGEIPVGSVDIEQMMIRVTQAAIARTQIQKDPLSYTVRVSFTSRFPKRAQLVANSIAQEYLQFQTQSLTQNQSENSDWLAERLDELRANVLNSERAVQNFSERHNLFELDGKTLDDQQLSGLNAQLIEARTDLAQAEARLSRARQLINAPSGTESVREVLNSSLIQALREKEAELMREKSELSGHFGPNHPEMSRINSEIADLRSNIGAETNKIIKGLANELEISRVRVSTLESELAKLGARQGNSSRLEIQLAELERQAESDRALYEDFLSRFKESSQAENLEKSSARIINKAELPLSPSAPHKKLTMMLFLMAGGCLGAVAAFLLEQFQAGFESSQDIERKTGKVCLGMIPELKSGETLGQHAIANSSTLHSEALRHVISTLRFTGKDDAPRSLMIASALPREGKGWLASGLAQISAKSGLRVLLIDCDLHRENPPTHALKAGQKPLNVFLKGKAALDNVVHHDHESGLDYIPSQKEAGNIQQLLEAREMRALMDFAHEHYDLTIIDCPPVIGLSDVMFLSPLVDKAVLAVQWQETPRTIVSSAIKTLEQIDMEIAGLVFTRVDLDAYKKQEFGSSKNFNDYQGYYAESVIDFKKKAASK
ncbi:MAG: polysaccharide biosynthesis tyrosine autokinase [Pseudomonadota bacterium]